MPQENGWATGPEHTANDGRTCPYCGSENTDSGSLDTQSGQVVEAGCECLDCGRKFGQLYNLAGWYDDVDETLHEDLEQHDKAEKCDQLEKELSRLREEIKNVRELIWNKDIPHPATPEYIEWHANCLRFIAAIDKALGEEA